MERSSDTKGLEYMERESLCPSQFTGPSRRVKLAKRYDEAEEMRSEERANQYIGTGIKGETDSSDSD